MDKENIFGKSLAGIKTMCKELDLPSYTSMQIANWLYKNDISSIDEMTNLSKQSREKLSQKYRLQISPQIKVDISSDGTKKYLYPAQARGYIEAAFIPEAKRNTLCISTQVGCKMGCLFCMTGKQDFQGNLSAGEILNQIRSLPERDCLTNVVFMGMGEPLDNLEQVLISLEILTAGYGYEWSPKRITVSTIGILPAMKKFLDQCRCHLAVSLHTPFDEERRKLMPIENVYPIREVINLIRRYDFTSQRRISFEYIMFAGINDSSKHVNELARLLNGIKCRINLIRFHPIPGSPLRGSDDFTIRIFIEKLQKKDIITTLRASRGQDINAACGLLSTKELNKGRRQLESDY